MSNTATATLTTTDTLAVFDLTGHRATRRRLPKGTQVVATLTSGAEWAQVTVAGETKTYRAVPRILIATTA